MAASLLQGSNIGNGDFRVYSVEGNLYNHNGPLEETLDDLLRPITDASHTRNRKQSPPDSACLPGTRQSVVTFITSWAARRALTVGQAQHLLLVYGFAGSGKSSIAQEVSERVHAGGCLLASFFFCRNAGYRSHMTRLPNTLASQLAKAIPTAARLIGNAVKEEPALVRNESNLSLDTRLHRLVFGPFKAATPYINYVCHPYLIVIDGLDECEDKEGVQEFIKSTLRFFEQNPYIPLRILITSRVEQHIQPLLSGNQVLLMDLGNNTSWDDIRLYLDLVFKDAIKNSPVLQAYVREHGQWPQPSQVGILLKHINGSFILASVLAKFILHGSGPSDSHLTPIDRLPIAVKINPRLDGLYTETLAGAERCAHFYDIICTIALLAEPLPVSGIAEVLGIRTYEVVHVLSELQAIVQCPGTDSAPVTICHTSFRDYLMTKSRSGRFFVPPTFHIRLLIHCLKCELRVRREGPKVEVEFAQQTAVVRYVLEYGEGSHGAYLGDRVWQSTKQELGKLVQLRREMLELLPDEDGVRGLGGLGSALGALSDRSGSISDADEAISVHREALDPCGHPHPERHKLLYGLGFTLVSRFDKHTFISDLEEAIPLLRESINLRPHPHPERHWSLFSFGYALVRHFDQSSSPSDLEEAIPPLRESVSLRPHPHPERHWSLYYLGYVLREQFKQSRHIPDLEESIVMHRELLSVRPHPHPQRHRALHNFASALRLQFEQSKSISQLEEAIAMYREALALRPHPHSDRHWTLHWLGLSLKAHFKESGIISDIDDAITMLRETLTLRPHHHTQRPYSLDHLGDALYLLFKERGSLGHLDEAISLKREVISLRPPSSFNLSLTHTQLIEFLECRYDKGRSTVDLDEAIGYSRKLINEHYLPRHVKRRNTLDKLVSLLQQRYDLYGNQEDSDDIENLKEEGDQ